MQRQRFFSLFILITKEVEKWSLESNETEKQSYLFYYITKVTVTGLFFIPILDKVIVYVNWLTLTV